MYHSRAIRGVAALWLLLFGVGVAPSHGREETRREKLLEFCEAHFGQKVGDGECSTLASQALESAGLKGCAGANPNRGDYVWGRLVFVIEGEATEPKPQGQIDWIKPGDIIQLRNTVFRPDGQKGHGFQHHTAIVEAVDVDKQIITILQQNVGGKIVTRGKLNLKVLRKGWLRIYEPIPK